MAAGSLADGPAPADAGCSFAAMGETIRPGPCRFRDFSGPAFKQVPFVSWIFVRHDRRAL